MGEEELYREVILDHYKDPRNKGSLSEEACDIKAEGTNPFCGDELQLDLQIKEGRVAAVRLRSHGCAISQASASMMTELIEGKNFEELEKNIERFRSNMLSPNGVEWPEGWEDLESLEGVRKYPVRIKCALLAWNTLREGVKEFQAKGGHVVSHHKEEK